MHLKRRANSNDQRRPTLRCSLSGMSDGIGFAVFEEGQCEQSTRLSRLHRIKKGDVGEGETLDADIHVTQHLFKGSLYSTLSH